jgi:acyl-CoA reductase-like NAD-dependent aldehyde dehydrogenase
MEWIHRYHWPQDHPRAGHRQRYGYQTQREEAGLPDGVLPCLPGVGLTGVRLPNHMKVFKVSFLGWAATGTELRRQQQTVIN